MLVKVLIRGRKRGMKTKSTREMIDYSRTWRKKGVKGIKAVSNAVEPFIDVLDRALEVGLLLRSEFVRCSFVGCLILSMLGI